MKTNFTNMFAFTLLVLLASCNFSTGIKKDLTTGLTSVNNGLSAEDIFLKEYEGARLLNNKVKLGSKISLAAAGIENFELKDGKVYPGCQIILTDKNKKEVINLPDAFADMVNGSTEDETKTLNATLTTGDPMVVGETYHLYVRFFDKQKKESEIVSNVDIVMVQ